VLDSFKHKRVQFRPSFLFSDRVDNQTKVLNDITLKFPFDLCRRNLRLEMKDYRVVHESMVIFTLKYLELGWNGWIIFSGANYNSQFKSKYSEL
jgi:hypothetical protein